MDCLITIYHIWQFSNIKLMQNSQMLYMSSSFLLLGVESRDFSHAEIERNACKDEQIHKMTTIFTQNGPRFRFQI